MNKLFYLLLAATFSSCQPINAQKEKNKSGDNYDDDFNYKHEETITKEYDATTVNIYNISGEISVKSYGGSKVKVTIEKNIKAKTEEKLSLAKNEIKLGAEGSDDLTFFIAEPFDSRPNMGERKNNHWDERQYQFELEYTLEVPVNTKLNLHTVNGDIQVLEVKGDMTIINVNGDISLTNVSKVENAHTVNGDVNVTSSYSNEITAEYHTINGDINLTIPNSFTGECHFKSMNGDFYTDFENFEQIGETKTTKLQHEGSTTFKIDKTEGIKIGNGRSRIKFETLNGDVHLRKS